MLCGHALEAEDIHSLKKLSLLCFIALFMHSTEAKHSICFHPIEAVSVSSAMISVTSVELDNPS